MGFIGSLLRRPEVNYASLHIHSICFAMFKTFSLSNLSKSDVVEGQGIPLLGSVR